MTRNEAIRLRHIIEQAVQSLEDMVAVTAVTLFPEWKNETAYIVGDKVKYGDKLYKCLSAHTSQADWAPDVVPALFAVINEVNAGTIEDPIPAAAGMLYVKDLYYIYNNVIYRCIRQDAEEGTILQFTPDALVGNYFEVISE